MTGDSFHVWQSSQEQAEEGAAEYLPGRPPEVIREWRLRIPLSNVAIGGARSGGTRQTSIWYRSCQFWRSP